MKLTTVSLLIAGANAQALTAVLAASKDLTLLGKALGKFPAVAKALTAAKDITLFLPTDNAKGISLLNPAAVVAPGTTEAALAYHVVKGVFPAASVPANAFVETLLTNANFSQVTGGQRLGVSKTAKGVTLTSGAGKTSRVSKADIKFDGGIIHLIDEVLTVPLGAVTSATAAGLTSLVGAVAKAGLAKTIDSAKDITIFAPTNAAFTAAAGTIAKLSTAQVADVLKYHVVKGVGYSSTLKDGQTLQTLQGGSLKIGVQNGVVTVNGAKVATADVLVSQGVVHVIGNVLVPPAGAGAAKRKSNSRMI